MNDDWTGLLVILVVVGIAALVAWAMASIPDDSAEPAVIVDSYGTFKAPQCVVVSRNCVRITDSDGNKHTLRLREDK